MSHFEIDVLGFIFHNEGGKQKTLPINKLIIQELTYCTAHRGGSNGISNKFAVILNDFDIFIFICIIRKVK